MAVRPEQLLVYAGGEALSRFGTFLKRTSRRDEVIETHARSSVGRAKNRAGTLVPWGSDVPRAHWVTDENGLLVPSTLLEGARTNELTRSEDLTHADWTANNLSARNANQATDPEGGAGLDELVEDGTNAAHFIEQSLTGMTANATYALSVWAIANTRTILGLRLDGGASSANFARAWFDLSDGTVGTTGSGGTGAFTRAYVRDYTDVAAGLYRCVLVGSVGDGETGIDAKVIMADVDGNESYQGDGSSSLYVGWAQVEDDVESASSYIPTTTAAASRNADNLYFDFTATPQEMTVYVKFEERGAVFEAGTPRAFHIGGATASDDPRFTIFVDSSQDRYEAAHDNGSSVSTAQGNWTTDPDIGDIVELRAVLHSDGHVTIGQSVNGGAEQTFTDATTAALGASWADERLYLNSGGSSNTGFNAFIGLKVAKGVHSLAAMQAAL